MWHISVADRDIGKIPKATNSKSGVADRMVDVTNDLAWSRDPLSGN